MTKILINYADRAFQRSQHLNSESGRMVGGFDEVWSYGPDDLDADFRRKNSAILTQKRGGGYWLWKPYVIRHALSRLAPGDLLFYCDSGSLFCQAIDPLVQIALDADQSLMCFELPIVEKHWTKRDAFVLLDCDRTEISDTKQRLASFSLWQKTEWSQGFAAAWLAAAEDQRILTDQPNQMGLPNYEGFEDHRHDQSIFSLLTKNAGLVPFRDPSQWGNDRRDQFPNSPYPQLIDHTRSRNLTVLEKFSREFSRVFGIFSGSGSRGS